MFVVELMGVKDECTEKRMCSTLSETEKLAFDFNPLANEVAMSLCRVMCNVEFKKQDDVVHSEYGTLGAVCNNSFRSVSQTISGCKSSHRKIRPAVLKYIENHCAVEVFR